METTFRGNCSVPPRTPCLTGIPASIDIYWSERHGEVGNGPEETEGGAAEEAGEDDEAESVDDHGRPLPVVLGQFALFFLLERGPYPLQMDVIRPMLK